MMTWPKNRLCSAHQIRALLFNLTNRVPWKSPSSESGLNVTDGRPNVIVEVSPLVYRTYTSISNLPHECNLQVLSGVTLLDYKLDIWRLWRLKDIGHDKCDSARWLAKEVETEPMPMTHVYRLSTGRSGHEDPLIYGLIGTRGILDLKGQRGLHRRTSFKVMGRHSSS